MTITWARSFLVRLKVNGRDYELQVEPRVSLLDALRERLGLTGTKKGCDHGQCGSCTVLADDRRILSCLTLAVQVDGARVSTDGQSLGAQVKRLRAAGLQEPVQGALPP